MGKAVSIQSSLEIAESIDLNSACARCVVYY